MEEKDLKDHVLSNLKEKQSWDLDKKIEYAKEKVIEFVEYCGGVENVVNEITIRRRMKELGLAKRRTYVTQREIDMDSIIEDKKTMTMKELVEKYDISETTLRRLIKEAKKV